MGVLRGEFNHKRTNSFLLRTSNILARFVSLRIRLPALVALLLALCTAGVVTVAYRVVRASLVTATAERLHSAGDRVAAALTPGLRRAPAEAQRFAAVPAIHDWLSTGSGADRALSRLDSARLGTPQTVALLLVRRGGEQLFVGASDAAQTTRAAAPGIGQFFMTADTVNYSVRAPLIEGADTVGYLVIVRSLTAASAASTALISNLLGENVSFLIGNTDGSLWTDFVKAAPAPLSKSDLAKLVTAGRTFATADTISAAVPVPGTPWILWIGQETTTALQPASSLVKRLTLLAALVVLLGALVAWWTIRRLTAPLDEVTLASEALARGDYERRIARADAPDEIGRLARSFNVMAEEIETQHHELEVQVWERTAELEKALYDLRLAQEENVQRERLAILGQLAGGVGHELRNPLGVMTNAVYVLESVLPDPDPLVRDYLGILRGQISLSEKIVADLLDFARTRPPQCAPTDVAALVRHQVDRLGPLGTVDVTYDFSDSLPPANIDPVQIGQVVFNLVTNATQVMTESGGTIRCRAQYDGKGVITLDVADSGPGMPPDVAKRIFEPLFTTKARGLGLGLTVSRMLAENNGCTLTFVTESGVGTTFTLTLPTAGT
jgi:signal transduction histidine kinase